MFSIIIATDLDMGIGKENTIPWNFPSDLKNFKKITSHQVVVMGKNTWDSLPIKPLPNRINIVISQKLISTVSSVNESIPHNMFPSAIYCLHMISCRNPIIVSSITELLILRKYIFKTKEWFIIGGATLYDFFLSNSNLIDKVYWTLILKRYHCDTKIKTFIPLFLTNWKWISSSLDDSTAHKYYIVKKLR